MSATCLQHSAAALLRPRVCLPPSLAASGKLQVASYKLQATCAYGVAPLLPPPAPLTTANTISAAAAAAAAAATTATATTSATATATADNNTHTHTLTSYSYFILIPIPIPIPIPKPKPKPIPILLRPHMHVRLLSPDDECAGCECAVKRGCHMQQGANMSACLSCCERLRRDCRVP